jgi:hypothetical protein
MSRNRRRLAAVPLLAAIALVVLSAPAEAARAPSLKTLEIATVPAIPAARFVFDGQALVTDQNGVARVTQPRSRTAHRLELLNPHLDSPDGSALDFVRWVGHGDNDQGYSTVLPKITLDHNKRVQVAFQSSRLVRFDFVDQAHNAVAPTRISSVTLRSDAGQVRTVRGVQSARLTGVRPVVEAGSAIAKDVTYYLDSVVVDGANVVNVGEQRVVPGRTAAATLVVLFRSVHLQVRDRLFGNSMTADLAVTYPDGDTGRLSTAPDGGARLDNLARGTYTITVSAAGYAQAHTVALSRSQYIDLPVLSYLDFVVIGGAALLVFAALVVFGRRLHKRRLSGGEET